MIARGGRGYNPVVKPILLAGLLLVPSVVRAAGDDAALDSLEARVASVEALARGTAACEASTTEAEVRADLTPGRLSDSARGVLSAAALPDLERLYNARAFVTGGPAVCDDLAPLSAVVKREKIAGDLPFDLLCKTNYYEALMAKATMRGEDGMYDLCLLRNRVGDRDFKLDSLEVSCRIIAERKGTVDEVCARLTPYYDNASIAKTCPRMLRYVSGDASVCRLFSDRLVRERCEGYVAFGLAEKGSPMACAKSPHCRMMRDGAAWAAADAEKRVVHDACRVYARREVRTERARALREEAKSLETGLTTEAAAAGDRADAARLDALLERAARLEARAGLGSSLRKARRAVDLVSVGGQRFAVVVVPVGGLGVPGRGLGHQGFLRKVSGSTARRVRGMNGAASSRRWGTTTSSSEKTTPLA